MSERRIAVIDSHTEGEPTRVVMSGGPDLGGGDAAARLAVLRDQHDAFRSAVVNEPRGFDAMVGALLCPPSSDDYAAQVLFFNNVGYLGMCVHGTIGVAETLRWAGRLEPGSHRFETPVGDVGVCIARDGHVDVENVASYRTAESVEIAVDGRTVRGDVAWGGNWFFLTNDHGQELRGDNIEALGRYAARVRLALEAAGVTGDDGAVVDHIELFGPPSRSDADSKNFVLCPGAEYDRSPCGTGTSAKMACLWADGLLGETAVWRQESIIGSCFVGSVRAAPGRGVIPTVGGRAWVTATSELVLSEGDPFAHGIPRTAGGAA